MAHKPDFWNTHQNIHVIPGLFDICVEVGRRLGIPAMRCHRRFTIPRGMSSARYSFSHPVYSLKGRIIEVWSKRAEAKGISMPDGRLYTPGYGIGPMEFEEVLSRVNWSSVSRALELVVHPATGIDPELFGRMTESRLAEYRMLREPALTDRLRSIGIEPVGFEVLYGC